MAEGFARHHGCGVIEPYSAGVAPTKLHPLGIEIMQERGVDISGQWAKGVTDVPERVDLVVTVCDQARETCPIFSGAPRSIHWSLPDPVQTQGSPTQIKEVFRQVRDEIEARVLSLIKELAVDSPAGF